MRFRFHCICYGEAHDQILLSGNDTRVTSCHFHLLTSTAKRLQATELLAGGSVWNSLLFSQPDG